MPLGALSIAIVDAAMDLVRDFKTAHLVGASPRAMVTAQFIGAAVSCVFSSAAYQMIQQQALDGTDDALPAVVAKAYRAIAVVFSGPGGLDQLPAHAVTISLVFGGAAIVNNLICEFILAPRKLRGYAPHSAAVGIAGCSR